MPNFAAPFWTRVRPISPAAATTRIGKRAALIAACLAIAGCSGMAGQQNAAQSPSGTVLSNPNAGFGGEFGAAPLPPATPAPVAQTTLTPLQTPEPFPDAAAAQFPGAYAGGVAQPAPAAPIAPAPAYNAASFGAAPGAVARHSVVRGDTVFSLARRYGSDKDAIRDANGLDFAYGIQIGQELVIPLGLAAPAPALAPAPVAFSDYSNLSTASTPVRSRAPLGQPRPMQRPVSGGQIVRAFGSDLAGAPSDGVGIAAPVGTPVFAADDGRVAFISQPAGAIGSVVILEHAGQMLTVYGRVTNIAVRQGQLVSRGAPIAVIARPPSGAPYLHFELRRNGRAINPTPFL